MHDLLLGNQSALDSDDLIGYAERLGLDLERFTRDLHEHSGAARVADDVDSADLSGVSGTPTFFVNGRRHYGAYDIASLSAAVRVAGAQATLAVAKGARVNPTDGVIREAWGLYKAHWRHLLPIAFVVYVSIALIALLPHRHPVVAGRADRGGHLAGRRLLGPGSLATAVQDIRDGRADLSLGETFSRVRPQLGSIVVAGLLAGIGIAFGLLLLIVPGLVLMTWWVLIIPVVALERTPAGAAFSRSRELVRGYGWNVFGVIVLTILLLLGFEIVLAIVLTPLADWLGNFLSSIVSGTLTSPFIALVWTLLYFRLLQAKQEPPAPPPPRPTLRPDERHAGAASERRSPTSCPAAASRSPSSRNSLRAAWSFPSSCCRSRPAPPLRVLEVGCGDEGGVVPTLAAAGYDVLGIDPDAPDGPRYRRIALDDLDDRGRFDAVVAGRVLHHVRPLAAALDKLTALALVLVVDEFAWNHLDEPTVAWYEARHRRLVGAGAQPEGPSEVAEWRSRHPDLHPYETLRRELDARYETRSFEWVPYLYRWLGDAETKAEESARIAAGAIRPIGYRYVGTTVT